MYQWSLIRNSKKSVSIIFGLLISSHAFSMLLCQQCLTQHNIKTEQLLVEDKDYQASPSCEFCSKKVSPRKRAKPQSTSSSVIAGKIGRHVGIKFYCPQCNEGRHCEYHKFLKSIPKKFKASEPPVASSQPVHFDSPAVEEMTVQEITVQDITQNNHADALIAIQLEVQEMTDTVPKIRSAIRALAQGHFSVQLRGMPNTWSSYPSEYVFSCSVNEPVNSSSALPFYTSQRVQSGVDYAHLLIDALRRIREILNAIRHIEDANGELINMRSLLGDGDIELKMALLASTGNDISGITGGVYSDPIPQDKINNTYAAAEDIYRQLLDLFQKYLREKTGVMNFLEYTAEQYSGSLRGLSMEEYDEASAFPEIIQFSALQRTELESDEMLMLMTRVIASPQGFEALSCPMLEFVSMQLKSEGGRERTRVKHGEQSLDNTGITEVGCNFSYFKNQWDVYRLSESNKTVILKTLDSAASKFCTPSNFSATTAGGANRKPIMLLEFVVIPRVYSIHIYTSPEGETFVMDPFIRTVIFKDREDALEYVLAIHAILGLDRCIGNSTFTLQCDGDALIPQNYY
ncbi:hypothetical protein [Spongorhabdus nitratireducens]